MVKRKCALEGMVIHNMKEDAKNFWEGKRVFLTGHSGFKGSWLSIWLNSLGAVVKGYSLAPTGEFSLYEIAGLSGFVDSEIDDIRDYSTLANSIKNFAPEIVFHLAAQSLVRPSYKNPLETYETNVMGTANLLEAVRICDSVRVVVNITTDKCYENNEWVWGYRENDKLGGKDPYSNSKACSELVSSAYRDSFLEQRNVGLATARAGNVIGGGDWATDRLIPDILRNFQAKTPVIIRNPKAVRPWQHVLEPLSGYLLLAQRMYNDPIKFSGAWNFGPNNYDVRPVDWILNSISQLLPGSEWRNDSTNQPHEAKLLMLDIEKAKALLGWHPKWTLEEVLPKIVAWHQAWCTGKDMHAVCVDEINQFMNQ